jgi:hypothetical protein
LVVRLVKKEVLVYDIAYLVKYFFLVNMASNIVVEDEQIQNGLDNSDDDEIDENGKIDDQSTVKAKKKRKKKKKSKGTNYSI